MACKCGSDRILSFTAKCSDLYNMQYKGKSYEGYVPTALPFGAEGWGDYVEADVCLDCGQIQNWKKVSEATVQGLFKEGE